MKDKKDSAQGWFVVAATFVGMLLSIGVLVIYSYGVLGAAMAADLGWTEADRSQIFAIFGLCTAIFGPIWGHLADRFGGRRIILISLLLMAIGFVLIAAVTRDVFFAKLAFAFVGTFGGGTLPAAYASIVVGWFDRFRGLALGISMLGVGVGAAIFPVVAAALTEASGWRTTALFYAGLTLFIALPVAAFCLKSFDDGRQRNAQASMNENRVRIGSLLRLGRVWILLLFAFLTGSLLLSCVSNFVPMLQSHGLSLIEAARYQSVMGMSLIAGRLATGALFDRIFAPRVMSILLCLTAFGIATLLYGNGNAAFILAALGIGAAIGAEVDFLGFMISRYFPPNTFTTIFAIMFSAYTFGGAAGPMIFGKLVQANGNYGMALTVCSMTALVVALLLTLLPRYGGESSYVGDRAVAH